MEKGGVQQVAPCEWFGYTPQKPTGPGGKPVCKPGVNGVASPGGGVITRQVCETNRQPKRCTLKAKKMQEAQTSA